MTLNSDCALVTTESRDNQATRHWNIISMVIGALMECTAPRTLNTSDVMGPEWRSPGVKQARANPGVDHLAIECPTFKLTAETVASPRRKEVPSHPVKRQPAVIREAPSNHKPCLNTSREYVPPGCTKP